LRRADEASVSVPPPGWVEPAAPAFAAPERVIAHGADMRTENRRLLDGRRVIARLIDWILVWVVATLISRGWEDPFAAFVLAQAMLLIYNHLFEVRSGATPGKRLVGLRVASLDTGGLPSPRQAATRGVIGIFEIGPIAAIAIIVNRQRRRLGDYAAGTAVVDARKHPIAPRPLSGGALVYPVLWAIPMLVVCLPVAMGAPRDSYRTRVNALCARADADVAMARSYGGVATVAAMLDRRDQLIAAQTVPDDWRDRHRRLLLALAEQTEAVHQSAATWARDVDPGRFAATVAAESVHMPGYESC
jgi:uncharacterized RDD family membrane protein YckC